MEFENKTVTIVEQSEIENKKAKVAYCLIVPVGATPTGLILFPWSQPRHVPMTSELVYRCVICNREASCEGEERICLKTLPETLRDEREAAEAGEAP